MYASLPRNALLSNSFFAAAEKQEQLSYNVFITNHFNGIIMIEDLGQNSAAYLLLEGIPDVIVLVDKEGKLVYVNPQAQKVLGFEKKELLGQPVEILLPQIDRSKHQSHRMDYFKNPHKRPMGIGMELHALKKNGELCLVEISLSPIHIKDEVFVLASLRDISERKRLENENWKMQEANRLKDLLLENISHELRTPLNGIVGFSELLFSEQLGPVAPEHKEYLGDIVTSSRQLLRLITDILNFTELESQKVEFKPEAVNLLSLINEVITSLNELIYKKHIQVAIDADVGIERAFIDPSRFKQIFYNYLSNAIKFSPNQSKVEIRLRKEDKDKFRLEIEDHGLGINEDELGELFTGFHQLDSTTSKKYPGLGLGLVLTKRLVEAQGGIVGAQSTPGKGSIFYAILRQNSAL